MLNHIFFHISLGICICTFHFFDNFNEFLYFLFFLICFCLSFNNFCLLFFIRSLFLWILRLILINIYFLAQMFLSTWLTLYILCFILTTFMLSTLLFLFCILFLTGFGFFLTSALAWIVQLLKKIEPVNALVHCLSLSSAHNYQDSDLA